MRSKPPHPLVRFRLALLCIALVAWAIGFAVLALRKGDPTFPVASVVAAAGLIFIWTNGAFWWLELRYPHIEALPGQYVSRLEQSSGFMRAYSGVFFTLYALVAIYATVTCFQLIADA